MKITITSQEVLDNPNDAVLGALVRQKYWFEKSNEDEHMTLNIGEGGIVKSIGFKCSICGGDTSDVDFDYLVGTDHLGCKLKEEALEKNDYDVCVICGKQSPYRASTHIDLRQGYVEGAGQGCFQEHICKKEK